MVDRIKQIMEYKQLTPAVFAEQLEISRSNLTHLFSGRNQPSLALAKKILETYPDINTEWLIMGVGKMVNTDLQPNDTPSVNVETPVTTANPAELDLFSSLEEVHDTPATSTEQPTEESSTMTETPFSEVVTEPESVTPDVTNVSSVEIPSRKRTTSKRANNSDGGQGKSQIFDSRGDKKVRKIVFFYVDKTFEEFYPE